MSKRVQRYASAILLLILLHSSSVLTADLHDLPHGVINVTQVVVVPQAIVATVTEPLTINYTTTESFTATQTQQCPTSSSTRTIYSIVWPSPDAAPIEVTSQSQVLTSYCP
jgi:hypothetical protein